MKAYQIKFVGQGSGVTQRILLAKDEKKKGLILPGDLTWSAENRSTIIVKELHESAIEFFKSDQNHKDEFQLKEIDVPDDFFEDDDVTASPDDLAAAKAEAEAEEGPEDVNLETTGLDKTSTRAPKARPR
jgi:hypothetical protein